MPKEEEIQPLENHDRIVQLHLFLFYVNLKESFQNRVEGKHKIKLDFIIVETITNTISPESIIF